MALTINDLETKRFGVICAQADGLGIAFPDLTGINRQAAELGVALISIRVNVSDLDRVHALEADGYRLMDTLVHYGGSLDGIQGLRPVPEGLVLRTATAQDLPAVGRVAKAGFTNYLGHYHADPRLDTAAADAAYVDWAETSVADATDDTPVLLAVRHGSVLGFVTTRKKSGDEREIVLNAVHPDHQGQGLYSILIGNVARLMAQNGAIRLVISTQINNYAVQRVWARMGLVHEKSFYTFHKWFG